MAGDRSTAATLVAGADPASETSHSGKAPSTSAALGPQSSASARMLTAASPGRTRHVNPWLSRSGAAETEVVRVVRQVGTGEADEEHVVVAHQVDQGLLETGGAFAQALPQRVDHRVRRLHGTVRLDDRERAIRLGQLGEVVRPEVHAVLDAGGVEGALEEAVEVGGDDRGERAVRGERRDRVMTAVALVGVERLQDPEVVVTDLVLDQLGLVVRREPRRLVAGADERVAQLVGEVLVRELGRVRGECGEDDLVDRVPAGQRRRRLHRDPRAGEQHERAGPAMSAELHLRVRLYARCGVRPVPS